MANPLILARRTCVCTNRYCRHHQELRATLAPDVAAGRWSCWRCRKQIEPGSAWDLGHDDRDPSLYRGPEHEACNRATNGRAQVPIRHWQL
jgi:hypothetical protein